MLSKRYARTYINVFGSQLSLDSIEPIDRMIAFLNAHSRILFLLGVPVIDPRIKREGLYELIDRLKAHPTLKKLIDLLIADSRGHMLAETLACIKRFYYTQQGVSRFTISSSSELTQDQKQAVEKFLAKEVEGTILYTYTVDQRLIAGIRMQSDTLLREHSVQQQLRRIENMIR